MRRGTVVRLRGKKRTAKIVGFIKGIKDGVVLDRYLQGFRCWNVAHLERVDDPK